MRAPTRDLPTPILACSGLDGFGTHETLALLLKQRGSKAKITEKVVKAAARNKNSGNEVMSLSS
jgi:hypothetical protein